MGLGQVWDFIVGPAGKKIGEKVGSLAADSQSTIDQRNNLNAQGASASNFADRGQVNYNHLSREAQAQRDALRRRAGGQGLMSTEMLRQGLQQQLGQQRSMAAGASPQNAAMAARTAAMGMGRASSGMAGQATMAGLQEQKQAEDALTSAIMGARQQDMGVALGSRQNAISGYGGVNPEKSWLDKYGGAIIGASGLGVKG
jgi:hypothetical protein